MQLASYAATTAEVSNANTRRGRLASLSELRHAFACSGCARRSVIIVAITSAHVLQD